MAAGFAREVAVAKTERIGGVERARLRELAAGRYWSEAAGGVRGAQNCSSFHMSAVNRTLRFRPASLAL